ncbi:MAG: hypothetical protein M1118_12080 [Chloroflexi bacterium]|nr:hypothetical protein [Chloroflexota bacterium]
MPPWYQTAEVERFQADPDAVLRHIGSILPGRPATDAANDELRLVA